MQRALHFRFYDKEAGEQYARRPIPFRNSLLMLYPVAARDAAAGEEVPGPTRYQLEYSPRLFNVAEHILIRDLYEYVKARSDVKITEFKSEDLGGRGSHLSQTWLVRFDSSACPMFMQRKAHLDWMGYQVFIHHLFYRLGMPCVVCHRTGHPSSACTTSRHLCRLKHLSIVATEAEVKAVSAPATPVTRSVLEKMLFQAH